MKISSVHSKIYLNVKNDRIYSIRDLILNPVLFLHSTLNHISPNHDKTDVFKNYLVQGKPGYVSANWPNLSETINLINTIGGVAVIAHPLRYKITATKLRKLIDEFKYSGGKAIEVITSHNISKEITAVSSYAKKYNLAASIGSDFHNESVSWNRLGKLPLLPENLIPVWELWNKNN